LYEIDRQLDGVEGAMGRRVHCVHINGLAARRLNRQSSVEKMNRRAQP